MSTTTTSTTTTWYRCLHKTGWYITAKFWLFKRRLFVCTHCGAAIDAKLHEAMLKAENAK